MAQMTEPKLQIARAVYDAMAKQHPTEHAKYVEWVKEGRAEILEGA
jgi:hypothetical protein